MNTGNQRGNAKNEDLCKSFGQENSHRKKNSTFGPELINLVVIKQMALLIEKCSARTLTNIKEKKTTLNIHGKSQRK